MIVAVKMLLIPLSIYFLCKLTGFLSDSVIYDQIKAMLIILSLPSMSSLVMLAKINKTDSDYVLGNVDLYTIPDDVEDIEEYMESQMEYDMKNSLFMCADNIEINDERTN